MDNGLVLKKVRRHAMYSHRDLESQQSSAEELIDTRRVKARFAHLLDVEEQVSNIEGRDQCELTHSLEFNKRRESQKREAAIACYLPVKLILSKLQRNVPPAASRFATLLRFSFGSLHAGLMVGDICIEWDDSSLIIPMPAPDNRGDFQALVDGASWQEGAAKAVRDMSIANRQNMETPQKLGIIYNYRDQKVKLIDDLVDVIVKYNKSKKYALLRCNCQNFVEDALQALRIPKPVRFEGNLGKYFEALKRGKPFTNDFETHADLDAYAKAHSQTLDKRTKEYLLCVYFQFHSAESKYLSLEEQEEWTCPVQSCLYEQLEREIENESLFLHHFREQPAAPTVPVRQHISATPSMLPVPEEAAEPNGMDEIDASLENLSTKEEQEERLAEYTDSGYGVKVRSKLERHPKYRDCNSKVILEEAEILSEKEPFRKVYFSSYIEGASEKIVLEACKECDGNGGLLQSHELQTGNASFEKLFNIDMNLILRAPTRHDRALAAQTPVLTSLQVGKYIFDWDETSLVTPLELAKVESEPLLLSPVLPDSKWCGVVDNVKDDAQRSVQDRNYSMQINLVYEVTEKKDEFLSAFINTVVHFNRHEYFHARKCNNQHFLTKAMKSLGFQKPPKLSASIRDHIKRLKPSKDMLRRQITNHRELDGVASQVIDDDLTRRDIEYLIAKYFLFHVEGEEGGERSSDKWACSVSGCKLQAMEKKLERRTSFSLNA